MTKVNVTILVTRWDEHGRNAEVRIPGRSHGVVKVAQHFSLGDNPSKPTVNWSAVGAVPSDEALAMAAALMEAALIAETMEGIQIWSSRNSPFPSQTWSNERSL
jgi:hypothetical protein